MNRSLRLIAATLAVLFLTACKPPVEGDSSPLLKGAAATPEGMVRIPAGAFIRGSDREDTEGRAKEFGTMKPWYLDEHPAHRMELPTYFIDKTEVTAGAYRLYLTATGAAVPKGWQGGADDPDAELRPVTGVNWYQADQYCRWLGKRLPSEAEWEKAARGTDGREYPWGDEFDPMRANTGATRLGAVMPVGHFPEGASPYGVLDMVGNVWEWTGSWYLKYPGSEFHSDDFGEKYKVIRGGGWGGVGHYTLSHFYRAAYRFYIDPAIAFNDAGFRCAKDA
jgi:formylglycine-generating enzyme required for sulfatase activity